MKKQPVKWAGVNQSADIRPISSKFSHFQTNSNEPATNSTAMKAFQSPGFLSNFDDNDFAIGKFNTKLSLKADNYEMAESPDEIDSLDGLSP
jgi:hypothetical protein